MLSTKVFTRSAAAVGVAGALALGASPATADTGKAASDGASVTQQSECRTDAYGTICSTVRLVTNTVTPRSGATSYVYHVRATDSYSRIDGTPTGTITFVVDYHTLVAPDGSVQENSYHGTTTATNLRNTCTDSVDIHFANGTYQYNNGSRVCVPTP